METIALSDLEDDQASSSIAARNLLACEDLAEDEEMIEALVLRKVSIELGESKVSNFSFQPKISLARLYLSNTSQLPSLSKSFSTDTKKAERKHGEKGKNGKKEKGSKKDKSGKIEKGKKDKKSKKVEPSKDSAIQLESPKSKVAKLEQVEISYITHVKMS